MPSYLVEIKEILNPQDEPIKKEKEAVKAVARKDSNAKFLDDLTQRVNSFVEILRSIETDCDLKRKELLQSVKP